MMYLKIAFIVLLVSFSFGEDKPKGKKEREKSDPGWWPFFTTGKPTRGPRTTGWWPYTTRWWPGTTPRPTRWWPTVTATTERPTRWWPTTWRPRPSTERPTRWATTERPTRWWPTTWRPRPATTERPGPVPSDHVRRLHNVEYQFETLSRNVAEILRILHNIPVISGMGEILKDVKQIPSIKKILTGAVIRFPSPVYGDENAVRYYVQGHIEILHDNRWGTICDDSFDDSSYRNHGDRNANVLCRMGGYKGGVYHWGRYKQKYAKKASQIWLDEVYCQTGNETSIGNCRMYNGWGYNDCGHDEDVGVRCYI